MVEPRVGILALQGGYQAHANALDRLALPHRLIRHADDLAGCDALILPGGESTTVSHLVRSQRLWDALVEFGRRHPVLGTCAGLILMSRTQDERVTSLGCLDVEVTRNAYGRQLQSFQAAVSVRGLAEGGPRFRAVFIRAPRILSVGSGVEVLAEHAGVPVLVRQGPHMGMSFHPELSDDARIHGLWVRQAFDVVTGAVEGWR